MGGMLTRMDKKMRKWVGDLAYFASIGFSVALSVFIGLAVGLYLDKQFESAPWMMVIFLLLGIVAGFRNIALAIKKSRSI